MSIDCSHGSYGEAPRIAEHGDCPACRQARIEGLLQRLVDVIEGEVEGNQRTRALTAWAAGQGKHPDD